MHTLKLRFFDGVTAVVWNLIHVFLQLIPTTVLDPDCGIASALANISEMERETRLERQVEGIVIIKAKGKYKGRVKRSKESK